MRKRVFYEAIANKIVNFCEHFVQLNLPTFQKKHFTPILNRNSSLVKMTVHLAVSEFLLIAGNKNICNDLVSRAITSCTSSRCYILLFPACQLAVMNNLKKPEGKKIVKHVLLSFSFRLFI